MDARLRTSIVTVAVAGGVMGVVAAATFGLRAGFSVVVGAAIAAANLYALAKLIAAFLPDDGKGRPPGGVGAWLVVGLLKMIALFGGVWLLMSAHVVDPVPLFVGIACLPIGIAIGAIVSDRRRPNDD